MRTAILAAVAATCLGAGAPAALGQDAEAGEAVFKKCQACHAVGEEARNKVGPVLNGVFGRQAGTVEDFNYSTAMLEAGEAGLVWTPETVAEFLADPREYVPGTKMAFAGLRDAEEVQDVIAYLLTFSPDYVPEGQSDAAEQPADE